MKHILSILALSALLVSCGGKKEEKKEGFEMNRSKTETKAETTQEGVPVDLDNKGIGPIKSLEFDADINTEMASSGEAIFAIKCTACHSADQRMIGPAMTGVYERRSPEWVMNMMLNPIEMVKKDPIAKALLKEYGNAMMTNSNLTNDEARSVAEYLRTL